MYRGFVGLLRKLLSLYLSDVPSGGVATLRSSVLQHIMQKTTQAGMKSPGRWADKGKDS
jgi:hypothetical protein